MVELHHYHLFGLRLQSELVLPELHRNRHAVEPDVRIELGPLADVGGLQNEFSTTDDGACLSIADIGRYSISSSRILVEPASGAHLRNVRLYLLGSAMGILLHQRGLLPLHANAIEIDGRAFAFMGRSGAGKSTLAAVFHDRGFRVIADDVCVLRFDQTGRAYACPGIPRLRLWEEALSATGREPATYELSYAGAENWRKFDVPTELKDSHANDVSLAAIYQLADGEDLRVRKLEGAEAADAIFANTYRGGYVRSAGDPQAHWLASVQLISSTPIFELSRPWDLARIGAHLDEIIGHAASV